MFLSTCLVDISICNLGDWLFVTLWFLNRKHLLWRWFLNMSDCSDFTHELFLFFLLSGLLLINLNLFHFFLFRWMFRFSLPKITIKLIPPWTALLIVLIRLFILQASEIILPLILPEGIFFLFFLSVHKIVHFGASSLSKAHLLYCIVFRRQWLWWLLIIALFLIGPRVIVLALFFVIILR